VKGRPPQRGVRRERPQPYPVKWKPFEPGPLRKQALKDNVVAEQLNAATTMMTIAEKPTRNSQGRFNQSALVEQPGPDLHNSSYCENAKQYVPQLQSRDDKDVQWLQAKGLMTVLDPTTTLTNPHAVGAAVRSKATAEALGILHAKGCRNVCDLWGSERTPRLNAVLNCGVVPSQHLHLTVVQEMNDPMDCIRVTPKHLVEAADIDFSMYDGVLLVNVYALSREFLINLTHKMKAPAIVMWVGHVFEGEAGHLARDGLWVRSYDPLKTEFTITAWADMLAPPYHHDPCDWLPQGGWCKRNQQAIVWSQDRHILDTAIVLVMPLRTECCDYFPPLRVVHPAGGAVSMKTLPRAKFLETIAPLFASWSGQDPSLLTSMVKKLAFKTYPVLEHADMVCEATAAGFNMTTNVYATLENVAIKTVNGDPLYKKLRQKKPEMALSLISGTRGYILSKKLLANEESADDAVAMRPRVVTSNTSRSLVATPLPPTTLGCMAWRFIGGAAVAAVVAGGYYLFRSYERVVCNSLRVMEAVMGFGSSLAAPKTPLSEVTSEWMRKRILRYPSAMFGALTSTASPLVKQMAVWVSQPSTAPIHVRMAAHQTNLMVREVFADNVIIKVCERALCEECIHQVAAHFSPGLAVVTRTVHLLVEAVQNGGVLSPIMLPFIVLANPNSTGLALEFFAWRCHASWPRLSVWLRSMATVQHLARNLWVSGLFYMMLAGAARGHLTNTELRQPDSLVTVGASPLWLVGVLALAVGAYGLVRWLMPTFAPRQSQSEIVASIQEHCHELSEPRVPIDCVSPIVFTTKKRFWVPSHPPTREIPPANDLDPRLVFTTRCAGNMVPVSTKHKPQPGFHIGIDFGVPMARPETSDATYRSIVYCREGILPPTPVPRASDPEAWRDADAHPQDIALMIIASEWAKVPTLVADQHSDVPWAEGFDAWWDHLPPAKHTTYSGALKEYKQMGLRLNHRDFREISLIPKMDEVLLKCVSSVTESGRPDPDVPEDWEKEVQPRAIYNVGPYVQVSTQPAVFTAASRLKTQEWTGLRSYPLTDANGKRWRFYPFMASSACDLELTAWFWTALNRPAGSFSIAVAGDDALTVIVHHDGRVVITENDFSRFDKSQREPALNYALSTLRELGVPDLERQALASLTNATVVAKRKNKGNDIAVNIVITRLTAASRATGDPTTTSGNSINNAGAHYGSLQAVPEWEPALVSAHMLRMGFKAKLQVVERNQATFLKGWFVPLTDPCKETGWNVQTPSALEFMTRTDPLRLGIRHLAGAPFRWTPLPSRILKAGKAMKCPTEVFRGSSLETAMGHFLAAQANAFAPLLGVPFFTQFYLALQSDVPVSSIESIEELSSPYRPSTTSGWPNLDEAGYWRNFTIRYGGDASEAQHALSLLRTLKCGMMCSGPTFRRLAIRDYC
jgi:hypothetical protein